MPTVTNNSSWLIGNVNFNFWLNSPVVDLIGVPYQLRHILMAKVKDFWSNDNWYLPYAFVSRFSDVA